MPRLRPLALALAFAPALTHAQALVPAQVNAVFKDFTASTPGCAVAVYQRGKVLFARGYGMADLNLGVPITPTTVFDIGSTSKQFAAASIVLLANEGKLSLSDDVRKYVPELPTYGATITIDHMLRHTSGLRDYNGLLYLGGHNFEDYTADDDALKIIVAQRNLNFPVGSKWDYSNTGFFLLSVIVQRVTGQTLAEFAKARLFTPLGMTVTHFRTDHTAILKGRATAYDPATNGFVIDMSNWDQTGDGGVNTNVLELARWDGNFYTGQVGGRAMLDRLQERGTLNNGDSLNYARGLFVDTYRGLRRVHHGGAWAGYRAMLMRFPEQGIAIGLACNRADADTQRRAESVADVVLGKAFPQPKPPQPARVAGAAGAAAATPGFDASSYVGTYFSEGEQGVIAVTSDAGTVTMALGGNRLPLARASDEQLTAMGGGVKLDFADRRRAFTLTLLGTTAGTYRRVDPVDPAKVNLAELAGTYHSLELGTDWVVSVKDGKASVRGRAVGESALTPVMADAFTSGTGFLRVTRGGDGRISGFELSASRMKRIRFDRAG